MPDKLALKLSQLDVGVIELADNFGAPEIVEESELLAQIYFLHESPPAPGVTAPALADFELRAQSLDHKLGHQFRQTLAVPGDFLDQMRRTEKKSRIREHENRLDAWAHLLVHLRHLQLVVEVG